MKRFPSSWSKTLSKLARGRKRPKRAAHASRWRNRVSAIESLEERTLLATFTWDGGGTNNNWITPANWVGDVAPSAGDDLVFEGTARTSTTNNFTAGTSFNSITFAANDFTLAGNSVTLADDIIVNAGVTGSAISLNVSVGGSFGVNVVDTAVAIAGVMSGSNAVTKSGSGTLVVSGNNSYSGGTTISAGTLQVDNGVRSVPATLQMTAAWYSIAVPTSLLVWLFLGQAALLKRARAH